MGWLSTEQVRGLGFAAVGEHVLLSDKASYHNCPNIRFSSNVRIDDFCVLSAGEGGITIGSYVHVAVYSSLIGKARIVLADFCNLSSRVSLYSSNDDYSGASLTNPMIPRIFRAVNDAEVILGKHVIVGSGTVILPGVTLFEGVAIGALSLVKKDCESFGIYAGIPAKRIGTRQTDLLGLEKQLRSQTG